MAKKIKQKTESLFRLTSSLVIVSCLSALLLSYVYTITKAPIERSKNQAELKAIESVIGNDFDNNPYEDRREITTADGQAKLTFFPGKKQGKIKRFAIKTYSDEAFGGRLEIIVGFTINGRIINYEVLSSKETPGLGTKVAESEFKDQFQGLSPKSESFKTNKDGGEIDAVTAATISSRAVIDAINRAYNAYDKLSTGGKNGKDN